MYYYGMLKTILKHITAFWGVGSDATGHIEKLISGLGGFVGIVLILWFSQHELGEQGAALMVASMGASAVLLFAVPNGALSQPWPLIGGHVISALIGVACAQSISNMLIAAPLSVALAIAAMYYLRCIHPPGGASALTAVIGGAQVHALGYQFVITPVLLNASIILVAAIAVNYAFPWRRYPASLRKQTVSKQTQRSDTYNRLLHADFAYALAERGSYVDISEAELSAIYQLAVKHAWQLSDQPEQITAGLYYSNGQLGDDLSVRKVLSIDEDEQRISFRIVAGYGQGIIKTDRLIDFSNWQQYEVILKDGEWHRIRQALIHAPS